MQPLQNTKNIKPFLTSCKVKMASKLLHQRLLIYDVYKCKYYQNQRAYMQKSCWTALFSDVRGGSDHRMILESEILKGHRTKWLGSTGNVRKGDLCVSPRNHSFSLLYLAVRRWCLEVKWPLFGLWNSSLAEGWRGICTSLSTNHRFATRW